jgi:hypothetical protein
MMSRLASIAWAGPLAAALALPSVGCASSPNDPSPIALADFPARSMSITCAEDVQCGIYPDDPTCEASTMLNTSQLLADIDKGIVLYDGVSAYSCLYGITTTLSPTCRISEQAGPQPPSCANVFLGTVAEGGACVSSNECASQECDLTGCGGTACCAGTCVTSGRSLAGTVAVGASCSSRSDCVAGAFCDVGGTMHLCTAQKGPGEACQLSEECLDGTACILPAGGAGAPVCAKPPAEGEACGGTSSCDLLRDFCDPATMKCTPRIAIGGTCVTGGDSCVLYAACSAGSRTCVARGRAGDPCTLTSLPCLGGLVCTAGHCTLPDPDAVCPPP